jgi:hypothetical protein
LFINITSSISISRDLSNTCMLIFDWIASSVWCHNDLLFVHSTLLIVRLRNQIANRFSRLSDSVIMFAFFFTCTVNLTYVVAWWEISCVCAWFTLSCLYGERTELYENVLYKTVDRKIAILWITHSCEFPIDGNFQFCENFPIQFEHWKLSH